MGNKTDKLLLFREPTRTAHPLHFELCKTGGMSPPWIVNYICLAFYSKEQTLYQSWCVREIRGDRVTTVFFLPVAQCYIPSQAYVSKALQRLGDQITSMEQEHPGTILIILGDFNRANLSD